MHILVPDKGTFFKHAKCKKKVKEIFLRKFEALNGLSVVKAMSLLFVSVYRDILHLPASSLPGRFKEISGAIHVFLSK